jgi:hypothetical protein
MTALYTCCDARRRSLVRDHATLNGIDFLEVQDDPAGDKNLRQRFLELHLLKAPDPAALTVANLRVDGGERVRGLKVLSREISGKLVTVELDSPGDFSRYTLRLVADPRSDAPPADFDPQLAAIEFSFKVRCVGETEFLAEFDCAAAPAPAEPAPPPPPIDYLARDYANIRRLLVDRVAALVPGFADRTAADPGISVLELLADAADKLAYQQDALAGEAYLGTARRRVSVRRHARLVDYFVHDGCNARTWAQLLVDADLVGTPAAPALPAGTPVLTAIPGAPVRVPTPTDPALLQRAHAVFETVHDLVELRAAHARIAFYTWSCEHCTLPRGSTRATLAGRLPGLHAGDVVIFEEVLGPRSGRPEDADPTRRHAVRLTSVRPDRDPLLIGTAADPHVTHIAWSPADALPFDLAISETAFRDISVARANIVLCDHGATVEQPLGAPPLPTLRRASPSSAPPACGCDDPPSVLLPPRFTPTLARRPLTCAPPHDPSLPASAALRRSVADALPEISVREVGRPEAVWRARRDLLGSGPDTLAFVVESESDQTATLRFGDGALGRRPRPGAAFTARYRVGNGRAGDIGADALRHVVHPDPRVVGVRNPLPAAGGVDPEDLEAARLRAPHAFLGEPARAVNAADYAAIASALPTVQRAVATFRWTGSFTTAVVDIDRVGGVGLDPGFSTSTLAHLQRHALAAHDVRLRDPIYVSIELELFVCADPGYFRSDVRAAVQQTLRDLFHPDRLTFGQPVHASAIVAAAQAVPGVTHVRVDLLRRQGAPGEPVPKDGSLAIGPREIARLDNNPNFAERGVLRIRVGGGK